MAKFYAVKEGRKPGIYHTWDECKEQVNGYSGAVYKSFTNEEEAKAFIKKEERKVSDDLGLLAYVDGSYNIKTKEYVEMYRTTSYEHSIDLANKYIKDFNMIGIDINVTNDIK